MRASLRSMLTGANALRSTLWEGARRCKNVALADTLGHVRRDACNRRHFARLNDGIAPRILCAVKRLIRRLDQAIGFNVGAAQRGNARAKVTISFRFAA